MTGPGLKTIYAMVICLSRPEGGGRGAGHISEI